MKEISRVNILVLIIGIINTMNILINNDIKIEKGLINITLISQIYNIIILSVIFIAINIPNIESYINNNNNNKNKEGYERIIGIYILGIIIIMIGIKELILIYILIELISFSSYFLIYKSYIYMNSPREYGGEGVNRGMILYYYFIISTISSILLLIGISIIYYNTAIIEINNLILNYFIPSIGENKGEIEIWIKISNILIIISMLFKLGSAPFIFHIPRLYRDIKPNILIIILIVPKIIYCIIISKIFSTNFLLFNILFYSSILTLIIGTIWSIQLNIININKFITYSSIINVSYILLSFLPNIFNINISLFYIFIYSINTLNFLSLYILFLFYPLSLPVQTKGTKGDGDIKIYDYLNKLNININININPLIARIKEKREIILKYKSNIFGFIKPNNTFLFLYISSIASFIGIPPSAGFYNKYYLLILYFNYLYNYFYLLFFLFSFVVLSSFIAISLYFKSFHSFYSNTPSAISFSEPLDISPHKVGRGIIGLINTITISSIFILLYPLYLPFLLPFFFII